MKPISKPVKKVVDILEILKGDTTRHSVVLDMDSVAAVLMQRETLYENKVVNAALFEILKEQYFSARVDSDKMISYYTYRLLEKPRGRALYDEIFLSAPNDICPYCTINAVKTLDHFLPKSEYPSYAVTPVNLIPSCSDCNTGKKTAWPTCSNDQTFHPYFDKVDDVCWITANLIQSEPLSFQYDVIRPAAWDDVKFDRAKTHFKNYNLNRLFSIAANRELTSMRQNFKRMRSQHRAVLKINLEETYNSSLTGLGIMDWKTIMYQELSTNDWFLDGCAGTNFFN